MAETLGTIAIFPEGPFEIGVGGFERPTEVDGEANGVVVPWIQAFIRSRLCGYIRPGAVLELAFMRNVR